jgi:hypothetical protein
MLFHSLVMAGQSLVLAKALIRERAFSTDSIFRTEAMVLAGFVWIAAT